jgi:predicted PurR-regulated permease PerM
MAMPIKNSSASESLALISNVVLGAFVMSALYFGRDLLVPLALAALLTFMLSPLVNRLQRLLGKVLSVLIVVVMLFFVTGGIGWVLMRQAVDLANQFPSYKENIRSKLHAIHLPNDGPFSKVSQTLEELKQDLPGAASQDSYSDRPGQSEAGQQATPVQIVSGKDSRVEFLQGFVVPILGPLGTAGLVLLLLIFMLLQRDDLRIRIVRLLGQGRISVTTTAMDEVGARVTRYLVMQMVINVTYGIPVAIGLYFIGVPNAMLWGALATVLRFIPYLGPWIAAAFPIVLSLAVAPSWHAPVLTITLFIVLELFSNNVMEPWLYGSSTGVTPVALIMAALVWTWLWGPVGLVLATPLTVCLVVAGKLVPRLTFLSVLLSDEEPLTPAQDCYHRLTSVGESGEIELVDGFLKNNPLSALFDVMLIPVIAAVEGDHRRGLLDDDHLASIERSLQRILDDLDMRPVTEPTMSEGGAETDFRVCCLPARAYRDELAGEMLGQVICQIGHSLRNASAKMGSGELVGWVRESKASVACISVVEPTTVIHARYLCSKLRRNCPALRIIIGLWGRTENHPDALQDLREAGADDIVTTVAEAAERVKSYAPADPNEVRVSTQGV